MDLKSLVQTGIVSKPPRILLHGTHGVGKSTFGAQAPAPIFIQTEDGLINIDVPHFPLAKSLDDVWQTIKLLIEEEHEYKTVVIDTLDWLEKLIHAQVCLDEKVTSVESCGYGKGYVFALSHWSRFFRGLDKLREKGMAIILLCHDEIKTVNPPDANPYDKYSLKIHKNAASMAEEWADIVLFAQFQVFVNTDKNTKKGKAVGGERIMYAANNPAYAAKNRYGITDPIPMDFNELLKGIKK